jgi:GTP cyclohydrolase I
VKGVIVVAEGEHLCMKMRGVRNDAIVTTIASRGIYDKKEARSDVLSLIYSGKSKPNIA